MWCIYCNWWTHIDILLLTSWQIDGEKVKTVSDFIFSGSKITVDIDCSHKLKRHLLLARKVMTNIDIVLKSRDITLSTKVTSSQSYGFSSSCVWMWELDHKEGWALKNWCLQTVVLEKTPVSPLDSKELKSVNPKGNQPCIFFERPDAEAEAPILWSPNVTSQTYWKRLWCWERLRSWGEGGDRGEVFGWHYQLSGHEFEQTHGRYWWTEKPGMLQLWSHKKSRTWADWTTTITEYNVNFCVKEIKIFMNMQREI